MLNNNWAIANVDLFGHSTNSQDRIFQDDINFYNSLYMKPVI